MNTIFREVTPLSAEDCFMIFSRVKSEFNFPIHTHAEYELNFIENGAGARRVVGDSVEEIGSLELTLIAGSNLEHGWLNHYCKSDQINEITIQFHNNLVNNDLLSKNQFISMKEMFDKASCGLTFSNEAILKIKDRLYSLATEQEGVHSVLKLIGILYDLSLSKASRVLSSTSFVKEVQTYDSRRIERAYTYMLENYSKEISLSDIAGIVGMTEVSFSRFIKKRTSKTFIDSLNEIRLGHATRMLVNTTHNVSEICLACGFNNISNFNRLFKKKKGCTPSGFRENYNETKIFL
ncbi:AraC family transcriptional regulator [Dysgonomonas termitidis]|uniref:AraC family transcriptional regulator n=1 Tax=Dysgonomonas termitidis TaxID=1516126 RepID=A0ABV9L147_9BACT